MSSHHFVKEGQEPALFVLDPVSFELVGPLLEWAPMVLVSENALEDILRLGIKIDVVIAADISVERLAKGLIDQAPIKILSHQLEESPLVKGLHFLISTRQSHVNILISPSDAVFMQLEDFTPNLHMSVIDDEMKWSAISSGRYEKWVEADAKFQVRKNSLSQNISFEGLRMGGGYLESMDAGLISIQSEKPFWVAQPHF